jgi:phage gp37-like protein
MSDEHGLDFFIKSIEDGIIALLRYRHEARGDNPDGYLKELGTYGGELDESAIRDYIEQMSPQFPLELVTYAEGKDKVDPATSSAAGAPRDWRHDCTFTVIVCDDDSRGEEERRHGTVGRPGVYKMGGDARRTLMGLRFARRGDQVVTLVPNQKLHDGDVLLNYGPFNPAGFQFIARLPGLTAYAQHFETYWIETEPDRRAAGTPVSELIFDITAVAGSRQPGQLPGVINE